MEDPKENPNSMVSSSDSKAQEFNRNDFTIFMDKLSNNVDVFYVKSEDVFQKIKTVINQWFHFLKSKFKGIFRKKDYKSRQYKLSKKLYEQQQELEKSLSNIESTMAKTSDLTEQIKEDTSKIILDIEWVCTVLEYQMEKIDNVENYMIQKLGSDWLQIKNNWNKYKEGEITRGEFAKVGLKKLGKKFLGIFVNTVS